MANKLMRSAKSIRLIGTQHTILTDGRRCENCDELLQRRELRPGKYESWNYFKKRNQCLKCDPIKVREKYKAKIHVEETEKEWEQENFYGNTAEYKRYCYWCKAPIPRKITKHGKLEHITYYKKRKYCSQKCELSAIREENELQVDVKMKKRKLKHKQGRKTKKESQFLEKVGTTEHLPNPNEHPIAPREYKPIPMEDRVKDIRKLARAYTLDAMNALVDEVQRNRGGPRIDAAKAILERGWGKPDQPITVSKSIEDMTEEEVLALLGYKQDNQGQIIDAEFGVVVSEEELQKQINKGN